MRTLIHDPPEEVRAWLERRSELGQDLYDEMWDGVYHVAPAPNPAHGYLDDELAVFLRPHASAAGLVGSGPLNVGEPDDYRVPDHSYTRGFATDTSVHSVVIAVEILSPDDQTYAKLDFYFRHNVAEVLIVDPRRRRVQWQSRGPDGFVATDASQVLAVSAADLQASITWPPVSD